MANESWVTGKKYRILTDLANKKWSIMSFINKAADTIFNDNKSAETKLGAINGITSDLNGESETIAASIKAVNKLNSSLGNISNIGNSTYNSVEKLLQYYIDNGYLPDINSIKLTGSVFVSSTYSNQYLASKTIDGDGETGWMPTAADNTNYIGLTLPEPTNITKAELTVGVRGGSNDPYCRLQASNDNSNWKDISISILVPKAGEKLTIVSNDKTTRYKYVRFYFDPELCTNEGYAGYYTTISEIAFYGTIN